MRHRRRQPSARAALPLAGILALAAIFLLVPVAQAFAAGTGKVEIEGAGSGEVVTVEDGSGSGGTPPLACNYVSPGPAAGTCENVLEINSIFHPLEIEKFEEIPALGSEFAGWTVVEGIELGQEGNALVAVSESSAGAGASEDIVVKASFALEPIKLHVVITGHGTVTSSPGAIDCVNPTSEECSEAFNEGEEVTLTASPGTGYAFAGWIGCKHTGELTCKVTMSESKEVTAVFLEKGAEGSPGSSGKNIVTTEITAAGLEGHCVGVGGVRVEVEGETATRKYICNGTNGANGSNGSQGSTGSAGPKGDSGAVGPQGPAGPASKVTCKVKGSKKVKVTCTVKQGASASSARLDWRLMRGGHAYSHGVSSGGRLQLDLSHLRRGRYQLHVEGQKAPTEIVVG